MLLSAALLVVLSGLIHATWNLFTKRSGDKNAFLWCCQVVACVLFAPWFIADLQTVAWSAAGFTLVAVSVCIHGLYVILLAQAYKIGDLSQAYPIMRGTSPLLVPIAGVLLFGESITGFGIAGIALVLGGIAFIRNNRAASSEWTVVLYALGVGMSIAAYTIVDKWTLRYVTPVILNEASNIGNMIALSIFAFRKDVLRIEWSRNKRFVLLAGVLAPTGYLLFLFALNLAPVTLLAPMREIGTVFGALFGIFFLKESQGMRRLLASVIISVGVLVLGLFN